MSKLMLICLIVALAGVGTTTIVTQAQKTPDNKPLRFPGVFVQDEQGNPKPLKIQSLNVDVQVRGTLATTTMEMVVYNPHNRMLEGEFSFPVADGQTVARFALDINGKMRDAVVVDKTKGRETFEEVIRTKIDPALLEWNRDNSFKARVYPINARGTRKILIAYEQQLNQLDDGFGYTIPFAFPEPIDEFKFKADVAAFGLRPSLAGDQKDTVSFTALGRSFVAEMKRTNIHLDKPFTLSVPVSMRNHMVSVNTFQNEMYLGAFLAMQRQARTAPLPNKVSIVWDASLSGQKRDHAKEMEFLNKLFETLNTVNVEFSVFANDVFEKRQFKVIGGEWSSLKRSIETMIYDGATQLNAAPLKSNADITILFSDGISTFGNHKPSLGSERVFAVSSSVQADHDVLKAIAEQTGGCYIDLMSRGMDDAVQCLLEERLMIRSIDVVDGRIDDLRPNGAIEVRDVTTITGRLRTQHARIIVTTTIGDEVVGKEAIDIDARQQADEGNAIVRLWAQQELQRLNQDRVRNEEAIKSLGMRFSVVTPGTSLIVLERIEDYVRFNIEPPASEPQLVANFKAQRSLYRNDSVAQMQYHLTYVSSLAKDRRTYLSRKFNVDSLASIYKRKSEDAKQRAGALVIPDTVRATTLFANGQGNGQTMRFADVASAPAERADINSSVALQPSVVSKSGGFAVRGSRTTETQVLVDGLIVTDQVVGGLGQDQGETRDDEGRSQNMRAIEATMWTDKDITLASTLSDKEAWSQSLKSGGARKLYATYLKLRPQYEMQTSFYLDVSDMLRDAGFKAEALRVLSCLAELHGEDARDLRILAHRLMQLKEYALSVTVFEDVMRIRNEEPQSYRDLALAVAADGNYQRAADLMVTVIEHKWHARFPEIELIALTELNKLVEEHGSKIDKSKIKKEYLFDVGTDLRVILTWDADNSDMDLWVTDPLGETCMYSRRETMIGGHMSRDLTGGYGPEEFILPKALKGQYKIQVHYYGDRQQNLARQTTIQVDMFTNYATKKEDKKGITLRLDGAARLVDVGTINVN